MCARKLGKTRDAVKLMREVDPTYVYSALKLFTGTAVSMIIVFAAVCFISFITLCLTTYPVYHTLFFRKSRSFLKLVRDSEVLSVSMVANLAKHNLFNNVALSCFVLSILLYAV